MNGNPTTMTLILQHKSVTPEASKPTNQADH
jgi:hypothetical protein